MNKMIFFYPVLLAVAIENELLIISEEKFSSVQNQNSILQFRKRKSFLNFKWWKYFPLACVPLTGDISDTIGFLKFSQGSSWSWCCHCNCKRRHDTCWWFCTLENQCTVGWGMARVYLNWQFWILHVYNPKSYKHCITADSAESTWHGIHKHTCCVVIIDDNMYQVVLFESSSPLPPTSFLILCVVQASVWTEQCQLAPSIDIPLLTILHMALSHPNHPLTWLHRVKKYQPCRC